MCQWGANRRALCTVYLKARGLPSNQREVDLLAVDMMIVAAVMHLRNLRGLLSIGSPLPSGIGVKQAISELSQLNRAVEV